MKRIFQKFGVWMNAMRWHHWFKGFWVLFALYGHSSVSSNDLLKIGLALLIVSLLSGAIYINNDIHDLDRDRNHPTKKLRPFASGAITEDEGKVALMILTAIIGGLLLLMNNVLVTLLVIIMTVANIVYTNNVKMIPYIELFYYGVLSGIRYWIGVAVIGNQHVLIQSIFAISIGLCMLSLLRYMEKSRYGNSGRELLSKYSLVGLKYIMIISGIICATASVFTAVSVSQFLLIPSFCFALYLARLVFLSQKDVADPKQVDDLDKMLAHDLLLKVFIVPYVLAVALHVITCVSL